MITAHAPTSAENVDVFRINSAPVLTTTTRGYTYVHHDSMHISRILRQSKASQAYPIGLQRHDIPAEPARRRAYKLHRVHEKTITLYTLP